MKKVLLLLVFIAIAAFVVWKLFSGNSKKAVDEPKDQPLSIGKKSSEFDQSFSKVMDAYYSVRDALVEWDSAKADASVKNLQKMADSLPFNVLKGDSSIILTAKSLGESLSNEAKGFLGEASIEQKRRSFNMMTEDVFNIIRSVQYGDGKIYYLKCPMAFNDTDEGNWLSSTSKIVNPYLGKKDPKYHDKMLGCGSVVDSLDFTKK